METLLNRSRQKNKVYIDANIIVNFAEKNSIFHQQATEIIEFTVKKDMKLVVSPLVCDESVYGILKDLRRKNDSHAINKTKAFFTIFIQDFDPEIVNPPLSTNSQIKIFDYIKDYNLHPRDAYHLLIMKANKISYFATFDSDFDKVFEDKVLKRFADS